MRIYKTGSKNGDVVEGAVFSGRYGSYKVIDYKNAKNVTVKFLTTGAIRIAMAHNVRDGAVKDFFAPIIYGVGFSGGDKYSSKDRDAYQCWHDMIKRCYSEIKQKECPSYKGCVVVDEWHNFQNFAEWYYKNHPQDGEKYDLDKDITNGYVKVYSPDNCKFVTRIDNNRELNSRLSQRRLKADKA